MGLDKSKAKIRQERILELLNGSDIVTVATFCEKLGSSESTIRNDLTLLEKKGQLLRVFGGAVKTEKTPYNLIQLSNRETVYLREKRQIASYVAERLLQPGSSVILDAGTTNLEVAKKIAELELEVTVLTPSMKAATILAEAKKVTLYVFGGFYNSQRGSFYDAFLIDSIKTMRADLFLMGVNGVSPETGFTITGQDETQVKNIFIDIATRTIALADRSKVGRNGLKVVAGFKTVDTLLTDGEVKQEMLSRLEEKGLRVFTAGL